MAGTTNTNTSSQPEEVRKRSSRLQPTSYSFPKTPYRHGIQFIFMDYDYNRFVSSLTNGGKLTASNANDPGAIKKLGFVDLAQIPDVKKYTAVELPFPRTLSDETSINNQAFERSFLYERLTAAIAGSTGGEILGDMGNVVKDVLGLIRSVAAGEKATTDNFTSILKNNGAFKNIGAASQYLSRTFLPGDLQKQIGNASGMAVNPLQTLAFTGVDLKNYSFTWDLFPSNQEDSQRIKDIVQVLKHKALPQVESFSGKDGKGVQGLNRAFLKYPSVVLVNLIGVDESHFVRFKPAMLTNVTVNYGGPAGVVGIMKGGKPAAVTLTLSFTELNIHTAEDYPIDTSGDDADGTVKKETPNS